MREREERGEGERGDWEGEREGIGKEREGRRMGKEGRGKEMGGKKEGKGEREWRGEGEQNCSKIYPKTHQIAPFFNNFLGGMPRNPLSKTPLF